MGLTAQAQGENSEIPCDLLLEPADLIYPEVKRPCHYLSDVIRNVRYSKFAVAYFPTLAWIPIFDAKDHESPPIATHTQLPTP